MRIGVVSDTHNNLRNVRRIVELFNASGVEHVVHTGDITQPKTLEVFAGLDMPLTGVFGNNDEIPALIPVAERLGMTFVEPPLHLVWADRNILVVHDPLQLEGVQDAADVTLYGHIHRQIIERGPRSLTFNPGECAGMMAGHNAIGVVDLQDLTPTIVNF